VGLISLKSGKKVRNAIKALRTRFRARGTQDPDDDEVYAVFI
jgi:hypothetical protein